MKASVRLISGFLFIWNVLALGQLYSPEGWRVASEQDDLWQWDFDRVFRPQSDFRTGWWYYTGHLKSDEGRQFGFQVTFFRIGMNPDPMAEAKTGGNSGWRFRDVWMGHLGITDESGNQYHCRQRLVRGSAFLAGYEGSQTDTRLFLGDWTIERRSQSGSHHLDFEDAGWKLSLTLGEGRSVLQGENGVSRKSEGFGKASFYYSIPRMAVRGQLTTPDGDALSVTGSAWFDREIGSSQLDRDQVGWNWFSIQFETGDCLMLYQMRFEDGREDPFAHGLWVPASEKEPTVHLSAEDFSIQGKAMWKSRKTQGSYPTRWTLNVPVLDLELELRATVKEQEFVSRSKPVISYWEGSHTVIGARDERDVRGRAYVELTGYAGRLPGLN